MRKVSRSSTCNSKERRYGQRMSDIEVTSALYFRNLAPKVSLWQCVPNFSMGQVVHIGSEQTQGHPLVLWASASRASMSSTMEDIF